MMALPVNEYEYNLDLKFKTGGERLEFQQNSINTCKIRFRLTDEFEPINITGMTILADYESNNGHFSATTSTLDEISLINIINATQGEFDLIIASSVLQQKGKIKLQIKLVGYSGVSVFPAISINVKEGVNNEEEIQATNDFPLVMGAINSANNLIRITQEIIEQENARIGRENIREANELMRAELTNHLEDMLPTLEDAVVKEPIRQQNEINRINSFNVIKNQYQTALDNSALLGVGDLNSIPENDVVEAILNDRHEMGDIENRVDTIRKLKFKLNVSPWWYNTTKEIIDRDIPLFKQMGVDGFTLCVHVENNGTSLYVKEDLDLLLYAISEIKKVGMSVSAIKMHCLQQTFDSYSNSFEQYKTIVFQVAQKFKNLDIPYFTFLNEVPNIYNGSDIKNDILINELSTYIRNLGFKVGVTFANDLEILDTVYKYPSRVTNYDCFFRNTYTIIGYKGNKTTYQDSIYAWEHMDKVINLCKSLFPDKPFILSECGIQKYWEALRNPALYNYPSWGTDGEGKVAELFYYGLFENKNMNSGLIDEVWMWFPEQMHFDSFYKFVNSYTNNGGVN